MYHFPHIHTIIHFLLMNFIYVDSYVPFTHAIPFIYEFYFAFLPSLFSLVHLTSALSYTYAFSVSLKLEPFPS